MLDPTTPPICEMKTAVESAAARLVCPETLRASQADKAGVRGKTPQPARQTPMSDVS